MVRHERSAPAEEEGLSPNVVLPKIGVQTEVHFMLVYTWYKMMRLLPRRFRNRFQWRITRSRPYDAVFKRTVEGLRTEVLPKAYKGDPSYVDYLDAQIRKSLRETTESPGDPILQDRTVQLVEMLRSALASSGGNPKILCVGSRNGGELDYIEETCGARVQGIDLFSVDPRIRVGDMHTMPFADEEFDGLYSCHSLEHSYDLAAALREFVRVTKPEGVIVIEVPTNFEPSESDRCDVGSAARLVEFLGEAVDEALVKEDLTIERHGVRKSIARVAVRLKPASAADALAASFSG